MFQRALSLALLSVFAAPADAFSVGGRPSARLVSIRSNPVVSTSCLFAEEEKEAEPPVEVGDASTPSGGGADILSSPAFLKRKLEVLKTDVAKIEEDLAAAQELLKEGRAEYEPQLEALQSEYKMIQARMTNQSKAGDSMATTNVVREMLDVLDNSDRAFGAVDPETDEEKAIEAEYKEAYQSILDSFEELGVKVVETVGKEFDYEVHQAVMQRPVENFEEGIVCEEYQKGFVIGETLIRAAMVAVAA
jgi:molecular chaperone GrpE